jgi:hypothetical protein
MTQVDEKHVIEQIKAGAKPAGALHNALAKLSSNGKPSPLFQRNVASLLDPKVQSPRKHAQPRKRFHPAPPPPIEVWQLIGSRSAGSYSAYSPQESPVYGYLGTASGPFLVSSVEVDPDAGDFSMAVATGMGDGVALGQYLPLDNVPTGNPWVGTGICASMMQAFVLPTTYSLIQARVNLMAPHVAEAVGNYSENVKAGSKDSKGRERVSGAAIIGGITVNTYLGGLFGAPEATASAYSFFLDKTSQVGTQLVNFSPLENNGSITVSATLPYSGDIAFFAVEVVLDINALIMGDYPGVSADNEAAWCDLRFPDNNLWVFEDGIYDIPPSEYAEYSCPLTVTSIEVWGGTKL